MIQISFYKKDNLYKIQINPTSKQQRPTKDRKWMTNELIKRHQLRQELKSALSN